MKVLITGTSRGIGRAAALKYLSLGHEVHGIDMLDSDICHPGYFHHIADIRREETLPEIENVEILFNNAGMQQSGDDIEANLTGAINITEKILAGSRVLKSILFNASASSLSGQEFPRYAAAKAGLAGYMRNVAIRTAPKGITCNAISLGGVLTDSNAPVMNDPTLWQAIMNVTPMKKWADLDEVCEWIVFLTLVNRSMSGQNLLIDNGEKDLNATFVWPGWPDGTLS